MHIKTGPIERHTLSVTVDNESGVLARIAGMFSARGYNIESLTVADISEDDAVSRQDARLFQRPHIRSGHEQQAAARTDHGGFPSTFEFPAITFR